MNGRHINVAEHACMCLRLHEYRASRVCCIYVRCEAEEGGWLFTYFLFAKVWFFFRRNLNLCWIRFLMSLLEWNFRYLSSNELKHGRQTYFKNAMNWKLLCEPKKYKKTVYHIEGIFALKAPLFRWEQDQKKYLYLPSIYDIGFEILVHTIHK